MAKAKLSQSRQELRRLLDYMLLVRPDEFGLIPEEGGFRLKEVLAALHEEGRPCRESQIRELNHLAVAEGQPEPYLFQGPFLTPASEKPPGPEPADMVPGQLFSFCRRRAHRHVMERGLAPGRGEWVVLAGDEETALKLGRRQDQDPVLVRVEAERAWEEGVTFRRYGRSLYLSTELPPRLIHLPPLPKERPQEEPKPKAKAAGPFMPPLEGMPGSFTLRPERGPEERRSEQRERRKSKKGWQKDRRSGRRQKDGWE